MTAKKASTEPVDDTMAANTDEPTTTAYETEADFPGEGMGDGSPNIEADFDIESEYEEPPLIPNGVYFGNVTNVNFDGEQQCIVFQWTLVNNGGYMSDGKTPVDGSVLFDRIWLPRPGDENELTKDGRQTKRAAKISMMKQKAEKLGIDVGTKQAVIEGIVNQGWIGLEAKMKIQTRTWQGRTFNDLKGFI